jgi:hypothetical protein
MKQQPLSVGRTDNVIITANRSLSKSRDFRIVPGIFSNSDKIVSGNPQLQSFYVI